MTRDTVLRNAQLAYQAADLAEAGRLYQQALRQNPRDSQALYGLGVVCLQAEQLQHAEYVFGELVRLNPQNEDAHCVRGIALARLGRRAEALTCFERAISLRPDSVEAISNYGTTLSDMGELDRALVELDRALAIDPNHAASWNNRGNILKNLNRLDEALECYSRALESDPGFRLAAENREYVMFLLGRASRCPPGFVRQLFEEFSIHYDETMLVKLTYRGHEILRDLATRIMGRSEKPLRIFDLGCGTGLAGEAFAGFANGGPIDGVDLSPRMIAAARARGCYRNITTGDIETELASPGLRYDLVLAADCMVYLGDLSTCFSGIVHRLETGGYFLFTAESSDGDGWKLTANHRFAHSAAYLRNEAERSGLQVLAIEDCTLRTDHTVPVAGFAVALRKSGLTAAGPTRTVLPANPA